MNEECVGVLMCRLVLAISVWRLWSGTDEASTHAVTGTTRWRSMMVNHVQIYH